MNLETHLRALGIAPLSEFDPHPPIDLRTIPRAEWPGYEAATLQLSDDIAAYLSARGEAEPLTENEITAIENRLTLFYALAPGFQATHAAGAFRLQRAYPR